MRHTAVYYIWVAVGLSGVRIAGAPYDELLRVLEAPRMRALLDVIAFAEGTMPRTAQALQDLRVDPRGYRQMFGGGVFRAIDEHPKRVVCVMSRGSRLCSSAAGRYQLGATTWDHYIKVRKINRRSGDTAFSPLNQDRVAAQIIIDCKALPVLLRDSCDFPEIIRLLAKKWASLPGAPYGQPTTCSVARLERVFKQRVEVYERYEQRVKAGGVFV